MDGLSGSNQTFEMLCKRISKYISPDVIMLLAVNEKEYCDFRAECASCFRSAVQLLNEGHISEDEYNYIVGLAFWIHSETCTHKLTYYTLYQEEKR